MEEASGSSPLSPTIHNFSKLSFASFWLLEAFFLFDEFSLLAFGNLRIQYRNRNNIPDFVVKKIELSGEKIVLPSMHHFLDIHLFVRGLLIGFVIAAPVGPVGVLCLRRTFHYGRLSGLVSGL